MKTKFTLMLVVVCSFAYAQEHYYNGSEKVEVYPATDAFILFGNETISNNLRSRFTKSNSFSHKGYTLLEGKEIGFSMKQIIDKMPQHISAAYKLDSKGDFKMFPTKTVRVKLKSGKKEKDLSVALSDFDISEIEFKYGIFRIHIDDIRQVFKMANTIYESGIAEFSLPDFYIEKKLNQVNDPLFPFQFQMHNTGQVIDGISGANDIDCNALEAWDLTLGDNITIAVIDQGLEAHEDFGNRLIGGYTPATNGNGTPVVNTATHGMNSAGVAAASDNNLGVRGVASNANLLGVNIFVGATVGEAVDGIIWAVDNGADVLSNSWGFSDAPCGYTNVDIDNAIQYAVGSNGRNGKGCVVVFAAGNQGGCVEYPATNPNVIAVGAIDNQGNQYGYSARGPELDLVAPSGNRFGGVGIRTLDRMGAAGTSSGNYRDDFDGTSAACPVVSGAAALVLSVNPNLTQQQVRNILLNTATDMGATGFDNNFGKGRVNALAAVEEALFWGVGLTGDYLVCSSNKFFALSNLNLPNGYSVSWSVSSNLQIVSSSNNGATIKAINSSAYGNGYLRATIGTKVIQKDVWVGIPSSSNIVIWNSTQSSYPYNTTTTNTPVDFMIGYPPDNRCNILEAEFQSMSGAYIMSGSFTCIQDNGTSKLIVFQNPGTYYVKARIRNSCGWSGWSTPVPIQVTQGGYMYTIFPNPTSTEINVAKNIQSSQTNAKETSSLKTNTQNNVTFKFYDFAGNEVKEIKYIKRIGVKTITISVGGLPKGMYFLKIFDEQLTEIHSILVE